MAVYNPRGGETVHIDRILTNISLAWPNNGRVGDVLAPTVTVRKQSDLYRVFGREAWLPEDEYRAPGTATIRIPGLKVSTEPYFCREYALEIGVTDEERENADSPLSPDSDGTELVTDKLLLRRELRIKDAVTTASNYEASLTVTLSGTSQWSDYVNSTPIADIKAGKRAVHAQLFMEPNVAIFPYQVMSQLEDHPDFIERIKYSRPGIITADLIASVVGLPRIIVPGLGYDTNSPRGTASPVLDYLWGKDVVMAYVPPRAGLRQPALMYEFVWNYGRGGAQQVTRYREEKTKQDIIRVARRYDLKFIGVDDADKVITGYLIKDAVA